MVRFMGRIMSDACIVQCAPKIGLLYIIGGSDMNTGQPGTKMTEINLDKDAGDDFDLSVEREPLPYPRRSISAICIRNVIVCVSGVPDDTKTLAFDLDKLRWHELAKQSQGDSRMVHCPGLTTIKNRFVYQITSTRVSYLDFDKLA